MSSLATPDVLATALRGTLTAPGDPDYDERRALYNAMIDRRPALIARCTDAADVIAAVGHARREGLALAVRGGGHNGAGLGSVDDGLVIDLSGMRGVLVDPGSRVARVLGGSLLGDVDHATHAFGLATPSGIISTTGVGGITLGGGLGHLTRGYGLAIDNLIAADVVLADGRLVRASEDENPDLFWALRGGGGNFGVVASFSFALHPVSDVLAGPTVWPLEDAPVVMRAYDRFIASAPDEVGAFFLFLEVPPAPPFPEELHGRKMCGIVWCVSDPDATDVFDEMLAAAPPPALHAVGRMPYPTLQSFFDGLYPPGHQWYWRADFVSELSDAAIAAHVEHAQRLPTMQSSMHLYPLNGAAARVGPDETAWAYRDARYGQVIIGVDPDPAKADEIRDWTVAYHEALHPHSMGGAYVNMMMDEGQERVRASYRGHYDRLAAIKAVYDPDNLFRVNQNIRPATAPAG
ncbi:MAG: FAD-binding oxidoreductase [Solirubrobacteraceae bacterium]